jgi:hypothetical protein
MIDSTIEHCLVVYQQTSRNQEVQVTSEQLYKILNHLRKSYRGITNINPLQVVREDYKKILYSPCNLLEIGLEDFGVNNASVEFN